MSPILGKADTASGRTGQSRNVRSAGAPPASAKESGNGEGPLPRFQAIADHYRLQILEGKLKVGDRLPAERVISEKFGAGRSSVREALFALSRLGFISLSAGTRPRVVEPDPRVVFRDLGGVASIMLRTRDGIKELQMVRRVVETGLARQAAAQASDEDLAKMRMALAENEQALGDIDRCVKADIEFHRTIAAAVKSSMLIAMLDGLSDWLTEQRVVSARNGANQVATLGYHRAIYEAIASRQPDAAAKAMDDHLIEVSRNYWG